jgi:FSR family fosmidomycin resistance protein-like MFS transporter
MSRQDVNLFIRYLSSQKCHFLKISGTLLAFSGLFVVGWYTILQVHLFSPMQGQSGTAQALGSISGIIGKLIPLGIGVVAQAYGLQTAMWLLLAGPVALLVGLPHSRI